MVVRCRAAKQMKVGGGGAVQGREAVTVGGGAVQGREAVARVAIRSRARFIDDCAVRRLCG